MMTIAQRVVGKYLRRVAYMSFDENARLYAKEIASAKSICERALGVHVNGMQDAELAGMLNDIYNSFDEILSTFKFDLGVKMARSRRADAELPHKAVLRGVGIVRGHVERDVQRSIQVLQRSADITDEGKFACRMALQACDRIFKTLARMEDRLKGARGNVFAKKANIDDADTLGQLIEMEVESMTDGLPRAERKKAKDAVEVTSDVKEHARRYDEAVMSAVTQWLEKNLDQMDKSAVDDPTPDGFFEAMRDLDGGAGYLYYMEAEGSGVGTADGDWDYLFVNPRVGLKALSDHVESHTHQAYQGLKEAITDAALNAVPEEATG